MRLLPGPSGFSLLLPSTALALAGAYLPACAQTERIGIAAPAVYADDEAYRVPPITSGPVTITAEASARIEYDDNIYALPRAAIDDFLLDVAPRLELSYGSNALKYRVSGSASIRRYANRSTENSEAWNVDSRLDWTPSSTTRLSMDLYTGRTIEPRGDPEARIDPASGPRAIDVLGSILGLRNQGGRLLLDLEAAARRFDAVSDYDAERDFSTYTGRATVGYRVTGSVFATATAFIARREFRLDRTFAGIERNATTWGGRMGVEIVPGGPLEGTFSLGAFRHEPDAPTIPPRTGFSLAGALTYRPSRRTAITLDASNGDVATFRSGAQGRTDTRLRVGVEQEIRHNLLANVRLSLRNSKYVGTGLEERTTAVSGELEYLLGRGMSLAASAQFAKRDADVARDNFERFRTGISFRLRF